jgi:signal recognition particle GTPase
MIVRIAFNIDSPCFDDLLATEATRILRKAIKHIQAGEESVVLIDSAGNRVGTLTVSK